MTEEERIRKFKEIVGKIHNIEVYAVNEEMFFRNYMPLNVEYNPSVIHDIDSFLDTLPAEKKLKLAFDANPGLEELIKELNNTPKLDWGISDEDAQWLIDNSEETKGILDFLKPYQERGLLIPKGEDKVTTGFGWAHASRIKEDNSSHIFERHYRTDDANIQVNEDKLVRIGSRAFWHNSFLNRLSDAKESADRAHIEIISGHNKMQLISEESGVYHVRIFNQPFYMADPIFVTQFTAYDPTDETIIPMNKLPQLEGGEKRSDELREDKDIINEFIRLIDRNEKSSEKIDTNIYELNESFLEEEHLDEIYNTLEQIEPLQSRANLEELIKNTENYFGGIHLKESLENYISVLDNLETELEKPKSKLRWVLNGKRKRKKLSKDLEDARNRCYDRIASTRNLSKPLTEKSYMLTIGDFVIYRDSETLKKGMEEKIPGFNRLSMTFEIDKHGEVKQTGRQVEGNPKMNFTSKEKVDVDTGSIDRTGYKLAIIFSKENDGSEEYKVIPKLFGDGDLEKIIKRCDIKEISKTKRRKLIKTVKNLKKEYTQLNDFFMESPQDLYHEAISLRKDESAIRVGVPFRQPFL